MIAKVGWWTSLAGLLAAATTLAAEIPFDSIRREAITMVAFLAGVFWLTRRPRSNQPNSNQASSNQPKQPTISQPSGA